MPEQSLYPEIAAALGKFSKQPIIDISSASNSAQACQQLEDFVQAVKTSPGKAVDLNAGQLLLTRGVLAKINLQLKKHGLTLNAVYSTVPQTQQAALDEGFFVKEAPTQPSLSSLEQLSQLNQLNQRLNQQTMPLSGSTPQSAGSVDLPSFASRQDIPNTGLETTPSESSTPIAPPLRELSLGSIADILKSQSSTAQATTPEHVPPASSDQTPDIPEQVILDASTPRLPLSGDPESMQGADQEGANTTGHLPTLFVKNNLRSGQVLRYSGNLVIVGDVHAGSEITASGDILVWGELRGIAHAGADGNYMAQIRAMKIEALQLRIADFIARRPDRVYYHKPQGNTLPAPEVAKVADGEIRIFKESLGIK